jgi:hypothetical protein
MEIRKRAPSTRPPWAAAYRIVSDFPMLMIRIRHWLRSAAAIGSIAVVFGCGPSREELGNIVHSVPAVPGANTPYEIPDLGPPGASGRDVEVRPGRGRIG